MDEVKALSQRIKQIREKYNLSQEEFGKSLDSCKSTIINYESGKRVPGALFLITLIKKFHIHPNWLLLGKGEMNANGRGKASPMRKVEPGSVPGMLEHLQIPAMRLALTAEYQRLKKIFKPLIEEFEENRNKQLNEEGT